MGRLNSLPQPLPVVDGLVAATATVDSLALVTRNTADIARSGVGVVIPFEPGLTEALHQPRARQTLTARRLSIRVACRSFSAARTRRPRWASFFIQVWTG